MPVDDQRQAPAALPPGKRPVTRYIGGCVGPRAVLDGCGKSCPHRDLITRIAIPTALSWPQISVKQY